MTDQEAPPADDEAPERLPAPAEPVRLARVTDPRALDDSRGLRARLKVAIPREWLSERAVVVVDVPRMLTCARCDGGGCDSCARSGALRAPADDEARRVRLTLPAGAAAPCVVRLVDPFAGSAIKQLLVVVELADEPSPNVRRTQEPRSLRAAAPWPPLPLALAIVLLLALAVAWALWR